MEETKIEGSCDESLATEPAANVENMNIHSNTSESESKNVNKNKEEGINNITGNRKKVKRSNGQTSASTSNAAICPPLQSGIFGIDTALEEVEHMVLHFFQKENFWQIYNLDCALEILRKLALEVIKLSTKSIRQEEKNVAQAEKIIMQEEKTSALLQQIVALQTENLERYSSTDKSYLSVAQSAKNKVAELIADGKTIAIPHIPEEIRHSPSEKIIIVKAEEKGSIASKEQQERFRNNLKEVIGPELIPQISAIRPTRYGGYTIILKSMEARDAVHRKIMQNGKVEKERILAPVKKVAKMLCREVPNNTSHEEVLGDFYGEHNPSLKSIPCNSRHAKIFSHKLGWTFELSTPEAAAIEAQGFKVRFGFGRELRLEEFIPLQQCYRCCQFGHNAAECQAKHEVCRLCANSGHSGRTCPLKEDRKQWKCHNCIIANQQKGLNLNTQHAAAQLHKCNIAGHEREVRKAQLAASGVYTIKNKNNLMKTLSYADNERRKTNNPRENNNNNSNNNEKDETFNKGKLFNKSFSSSSLTIPSSSSSVSKIFSSSSSLEAFPKTNGTIKFTSNSSILSTSSSLSASSNQRTSSSSSSLASVSSINNKQAVSSMTRGRNGRNINNKNNEIGNTSINYNEERKREENKKINEDETMEKENEEENINNNNDKSEWITIPKGRGRGRGRGRGGNEVVNASNVGRGSGSDQRIRGLGWESGRGSRFQSGGNQSTS